MRIALVEDEKKLGEIVKTGLIGEGYSVDLYADGAIAEETCLRHGNVYDIIILDLGLPHRGGFAICEALRRNGIQTPILILTARDSTHDRVSLLDVGADDFMSKPFDFDELLARVRALLRRPRQVLKDEITFADLHLSSKTHEVHRAGKLITLTPTEFAILHHLMRHTPRVVSRDELAETIWSGEGHLSSNVIDAHIKNLREKIDRDYEQNVIQTIRGVGFTLQA